MSRLVLVDGNAILHRAYHALPSSLTNKKGEPTNAVYGFVAILLRVIENLKPTHLAVAFDRAAPTFRKELFKDYQAQRPEMEEALVSQVDKVHEVLQAMQIPIFEMDGYEADDVIGTIAKKSSVVSRQSSDKNIDEVVVVTGDRDLLQLVSDRVKLYMPVKGLTEAKLFGEIEAEERMGVKPEQVPDLKALMGDASDNYPGVIGIGPKTAVDLLKQFGTVAKLYKKLLRVSPKVREKLAKDKDNAFLSLKLATVVCDAPIEFDPKQAQLPQDFLTREVIEAFGKLGFKTLLRRLTELNNKQKVTLPNVSTSKKPEEQMGLF